MANRARGEAGLIVNGKAVALALNLGALAAVEDAFGGESYEDVFAEVLSGEKIHAAKVRRLMLAIGEANGHDIESAIDAMMPVDMTALAMDLLQRAFPEPSSKKKATAKNP